MKKAIIIVALVMALKPGLPLLDYFVNYDYIAKELCENKAKPELQCNGKCHLMKELAKASEGEKPASEKKQHTDLEVLFCNSLPNFSIAAYKVQTGIPGDFYSDLYYHTTLSGYFHPPAVI